ncbi:MAG: hypothetical protein K2K97_08950, partial [Muribaculaceae bacterium]|nr:hypothetical protein [Muribaculaceae bacterium]
MHRSTPYIGINKKGKARSSYPLPSFLSEASRIAFSRKDDNARSPRFDIYSYTPNISLEIHRCRNIY